jgi:hypothetical protein
MEELMPDWRAVLGMLEGVLDDEETVIGGLTCDDRG